MSGVKIVVKASYPRNTTDVKAAVDQVIKADPPLIYLVSITTAKFLAFDGGTTVP